MSSRLTMVMLGALLATATTAPAQPEPPEHPWTAGVSEPDQARALELFERGRVLLDQGLYREALELNRQAIAAWDHPAIRYNIAVALIFLERPIDAYEELDRALRFPEALEPDVYQQALVYQRLLRAQIVHLTIECVVPGTQITLDGNALAVPCPGSATQLVLPRRHELIAAKPGSVTHAIEVVPSGGEAPHVRVDLMTIAEATVTTRRWPWWKPWAVVGAGAVVGLAGLGVELQSAATYDSYDRAVAVLCPSRPCQTLPGVVTDAYARARTEHRAAIGLFAVGAATAATGAVLLWLDREVSERIGYDRVPILNASRGGATLGVRGRF